MKLPTPRPQSFHSSVPERRSECDGLVYGQAPSAVLFDLDLLGERDCLVPRQPLIGVGARKRHTGRLEMVSQDYTDNSPSLANHHPERIHHCEYLDTVYHATVRCDRWRSRASPARPSSDSSGGGRRLKGVGWANVARVAARKLDMLDYAAVRTDLASPPGNRIEALKGSLRGFHSIRINDQWRIVFRWIDSGSAEVDIRDYH
jgi:proteic killer suppression protein